MQDYLQFYLSNLEPYLFDTVHGKFHKDQFLSAFDFFCIIIWKAERAKTKIAYKLLRYSNRKYKTLDEAVKDLTKGIAEQGSRKERLRYIVKKWKFPLPTASAILTVLYPDQFTVYDQRVAGILGGKHPKLKNKVNFENMWRGYEEYIKAVKGKSPVGYSLRDKDRHLWGEAFYRQLQEDIESNFEKKSR